MDLLVAKVDPLMAMDHMKEGGVLEEVTHLPKDFGWDLLRIHGIIIPF
jgi:hypothetical protein